MTAFVTYERSHLSGVVALCQAEGWPSFPADPERAHRALTAPGVTTVVALDGGEVVGFACLQSDGEIQAHLSLIAVDARCRRGGIGRNLIGEALRGAGGERVDLVTDGADAFYAALVHRRMAGYRLYPPFVEHPVALATGPEVRAAVPADSEWREQVLTNSWGATVIVSRGRLHDAADLPALVAEREGQRLGLATYRIEGDEIEMVTIDALIQGHRVGTALLEAVTAVGRDAGCRRLWLITTNDNLDALRFYQRRGLRLVAIHRDAVDRARRIKPQIPHSGAYTIAIHDEIELELLLDPVGDHGHGRGRGRGRSSL
jgi:ribosomal protein S18 acetylase RimI-like enzyme